MRIHAGLLESSSPWKELLDQEGLQSSVADPGRLDPKEWSVLVVNRPPTGSETQALKTYLHEGGSIIGYTGHLAGFDGVDAYPGNVEYLVSDGDSSFDVLLADVGTDGMICREANSMRTLDGTSALFHGDLLNGHAVLLPFDPALAMFDERNVNRAFYYTKDRLPSERVSFVAKNELRHLLHRSLELLHHARGIPYVHAWYHPGGVPAMFAFRVDTDGADRDTVQRLYDLATEHRIPLSWYLDLESQEPLLADYGRMAGQEISLHCYRHKEFDAGHALAEDIRIAREKLERGGLRPSGFAAPFGFWNRSVAAVIDGAGFEYSSEFSCAYDTLPFYPHIDGRRGAVLQVPVHPICTGSMLRVGYSAMEMSGYFKQVVGWKVLRGEPLFFYHHPSHECWDILDGLFRMIHEMRTGKTTLLEYARWWKRRVESLPELTADPGGVTVRSAGGDDVWVQVTLPDGKAIRRPAVPGAIRIDEFADVVPAERISPPSDIRRIREFDARSRFADFYNAILRKLR
jgi:hypothetical protein